MLRRLALLAILFSTLAFSVNAEELFALTSDGKLIRFDSAAPETTLTTVSITGLQSGETVLGIDFRPADGKLYALGSTSRLYTIATATGAATVIGNSPFTPLLSGTKFGFNFNPTSGSNAGTAIRVVSDTAQNLRLSAATGAVIVTPPADASPVYSTNGLTGTPQVVAVSYTNSVIGATTTNLYVIDSSKDALFQQDVTTGSLTLIGFLGVDTDTNVGFEISGQTGIAYASLKKAGQSASTLFTINLVTGGASEIGDITGGTVIGLTAPPPPVQVAYAVNGSNLRRFPLAAPSVSLGDVTLSNVTGTIVGIDFRPANGLLYALTSNSNVNAFQLFSIDLTGATSTASATKVGSDFVLPNTPGGAYDIDFNPTVDRIRVVASTGTNARLNPDTGVIAAIDTSLAFAAGDVNTGTPAVVAAAYTNNFAGATTTTLYDLDSINNVLTTQLPPNNGTLNTVGGLKINANPTPSNTSVNAAAAFDIAPDGRAFATLGGSGNLFQINLATGALISIGTINGGLNEFAIPTNSGTSNASSGAISFTASSFQAVEGTTVAVTLTRTGGSAGFASVFVTTSGNGTVNSATPDLDYTPVGQTVSFADGETSRTVLFEALTDSTLEVFETVQLSITNPVGCAVGTQGTTTIVIVDVDDRDGDGFTTAEELAAGTSDNNASDTPFGGAPAGASNTTDLTITKVAIKLNFAKTLSDSISFSGTIGNFTDANFAAIANQKFVVNVGGVTKSLVMTAKGKGVSTDKKDSVSIGKPKNNISKFSAKFNKGSFATALTDEGLANDTDSPTKAARTVGVRVLFLGKRYEETQALVTTIKAGKGSSSVNLKVR